MFTSAEGIKQTSRFSKRNAGIIGEPAHDAGPFPESPFLLGDDQAASVGPERVRLAQVVASFLSVSSEQPLRPAGLGWLLPFLLSKELVQVTLRSRASSKSSLGSVLSGYPSVMAVFIAGSITSAGERGRATEAWGGQHPGQVCDGQPPSSGCSQHLPTAHALREKGLKIAVTSPARR